MKRSLEMPVADGRTDRTEFIGPLSALPALLGDTIKRMKLPPFSSRDKSDATIKVSLKKVKRSTFSHLGFLFFNSSLPLPPGSQTLKH